MSDTIFSRADGAFGLQARLEAAMARAARSKRTVIGTSANGRRTYAAVGLHATRPEDEAFPVGCAAKLLVAVLLDRKLVAHGVGYDARVAPLIDAPAEPLGDTTLRHLLEHTHGLDDAALSAAPRDADGRIDVRPLLAGLVGRRFASSGELYSYSNLGAWLAAAVLERLDGRRFVEQLRDEVLHPLGIPLEYAGSDASSAACPATGGGLSLRVGDWLTFLEASAAGLPAGGSASHDVTPLPGWHPLERGVLRGWKVYGGGWFGHQSAWPGASLLLRVRPGDRAAVVVASEGHHAAVVAAKALGGVLPELCTFSLPRRLSAGGRARLDHGPYCGRYASAAEALDVERAASALTLRAGDAQTSLVPAGGDVFFLEEAAAGRSFVQFLRRDGRGFRYLWDGRRVFPLAESSRHVPRRDARRSP